jgi:hypothetical protein
MRLKLAAAVILAENTPGGLLFHEELDRSRARSNGGVHRRRVRKFLVVLYSLFQGSFRL